MKYELWGHHNHNSLILFVFFFVLIDCFWFLVNQNPKRTPVWGRIKAEDQTGQAAGGSQRLVPV